MTVRKVVENLLRKRSAPASVGAPSPDVAAIEGFAIFDRQGYLCQYPDVADAGVDPLVHYVDSGAREGRNPCALFDTAYYLAHNPDVAASGANPLLHFCQTGWKQSRRPGPDFDPAWYADTYLGAARDWVNPLLHYLTVGRAEGNATGPSSDHDHRVIEASGLFDRDYYLARYPDIGGDGVDPIVHYLKYGAAEGRDPSRHFSTHYYLRNNPDVAASGVNPLAHFCQLGWKECRNPGPGFDIAWYADTYLGAARGSVNPLVHYLSAERIEAPTTQPVDDLDYRVIEASGLFDRDFYLAQYGDVGDQGADPIVHYLRYGASEHRDPNRYFSTRYYLQNNPELAPSGINPLVHFCQSGWRELRNPSPEFDVWWYWSTHLDPTRHDVNPLAHYLVQGRALDLDTRPPRSPSQLAGSGHRHPPGRAIKRICLYAGFDPHGLVDGYVVDYLRELSQYADVYYLADCEMQPGELQKLADCTRGAWAQRHGEYDMGSYSRLARERVGWDVIERYDELILANDSCYLLRDLQQVFANMDGRACDWWGMQATKGIAATRGNPRNQFLQPIPMTTVRASLLGNFESDYQYDFLIGSYFVVYRQPVIGDRQFRRLLDSVTAQDSKKNVIVKYEIGLTRYLIASGFAFDTFIGSLYPFHPIYSNWYFQLLEEGFPFLKRYFLSHNHYRVSGLASWKQRIGRKLPQANLDTIVRNLQRVVDPQTLQRNLQTDATRPQRDGPVPDALLDSEDFLAADQISPKHGDWWAFPVCAFTGMFSGNERAVFEEVKDDPAIRKIILTRDQPVTVEGANVELVPLESPQGQHLLMRCGTIFIKHSPTRNLVFPLAPELHNIINLWHGIPFKRIGYAALDMQSQPHAIAAEHAKCKAVISSSKVDTLAMATAFYPLSYADVWPTGLPRNDFILRPFDCLPADMRDEAQALDAQLDGRKLVLFMPTFRNDQENGCYRFSDAEIDVLAGWLQRNHAVLGLREHMADRARVYTRMLAKLDPLDLSDVRFPNVEILYRCSSALITDYSSCFIDYLLTGKPAVSFAYDHDNYASLERGSFYDLDFVFPGPVCRSFDDLRRALERLFEPPSAAATARLDWQRQLFFDHVDDRNAARVVARAKQLVDLDDIGKTGFAKARA